MFSRLSSRLTYANVVATIALFVALGGGAYAAVTLPAKSVGSKQIKANAVSSSKVRDRSLRARDFARGQLPRGAQGPPGPQGASGTNGTNGINGSTLAARPHTAAPFQTVTGSTTLPVPPNVTLTGNNWTQQPGEVDYITGQANVTAPASCVSSGSLGFVGGLYLDGNSIGSEPGGSDANAAGYYNGPSTLDVRDVFNPPGRNNLTPGSAGQTNLLVLPAPAVATPHTLTAGVLDLCAGGNHYTVNSLEVEVASAR
jgi:hypothetical protein